MCVLDTMLHDIIGRQASCVIARLCIIGRWLPDVDITGRGRSDKPNAT